MAWPLRPLSIAEPLERSAKEASPQNGLTLLSGFSADTIAWYLALVVNSFAAGVFSCVIAARLPPEI